MIDLLPAIDLVQGQAVRLHQGKAGSEEVFGQPLDLARAFALQGAKWLHLVDLDAAFGRGSNALLVEQIVKENPGLQVEVSGGIRDDASLESVLEAGARRVNLGTAAIENPLWCEKVLAKWGEKIAIGLDVKDGCVAGRGWTTQGPKLLDIISRLNDQGAQRYVVTDVSKDGTLSGPNLELLREVCNNTQARVVASGGISELADIQAVASLSALGVDGVIVGKAIYAKRFSVEQALDLLKQIASEAKS